MDIATTWLHFSFRISFYKDSAATQHSYQQRDIKNRIQFLPDKIVLKFTIWKQLR